MPAFGAILTRAGRAALINAEVGDALVSLTHFAVGDGAITLDENRTELVNETARVAVTAIQRDQDDPTIFQIDGTIPAATGGFTVREVGVFDSLGVLFAIGIVPDTVKPTINDGATKDLALRLSVRIANADGESLNLQVNPFLAAASSAQAQQRLPAFVAGKRAYNIGAFPVQSNGVRSDDVNWTGPRTELPGIHGAQNDPIVFSGANDETATTTYRGRLNPKVKTYDANTDDAIAPTIGRNPFQNGLNNTALGLANRIADDADGLDQVNLAIIGQGGQSLHRYDEDDADPSLWTRLIDEAPKALEQWGEAQFDCIFVSIGESHATGTFGDELNAGGAIATHAGRIAIAEKVLTRILDLPYVRDDADIVIQLHYTSATRRAEMNRAWEVLADRHPNMHITHARDAISVDNLHFANAHDVGYYTAGDVWRAAVASGQTRFMPEAMREALGPEGTLLPSHRVVFVDPETSLAIDRAYLHGHVFQTRANIITLPQVFNGHDGCPDLFIHNFSGSGLNPEDTGGTIVRPHSGTIRVPQTLGDVPEIVLEGVDIVWLKWINNRWRTMVWESRNQWRETNFGGANQFRLKPYGDGDNYQWLGKTGDIAAGASVNIVYPTRFNWTSLSGDPLVEVTWAGALILGAGFHNQPNIAVTDITSQGFTVTNNHPTDTFQSADFIADGILDADPFA